MSFWHTAPCRSAIRRGFAKGVEGHREKRGKLWLTYKDTLGKFCCTVLEGCDTCVPRPAAVAGNKWKSRVSCGGVASAKACTVRYHNGGISSDLVFDDSNVVDGLGIGGDGDGRRETSG